MLSLISFTAARTLGGQPAPELPVPDFAGQSAVGGPSDAGKAAGQNDASACSAAEWHVEDVHRPRPYRLADGKVVVLLFTEKNAADDAATARHFSTLSSSGAPG